MIEARYLYLDILHPKESAQRTGLLESGVKRFPQGRVLKDLLLEEYALHGRETDNKEFIEQMTKDFPTDWFPYARRALLEVKEGQIGEGALTWVSMGLDRLPDSLPLNLLHAVLLIQQEVRRRRPSRSDPPCRAARNAGLPPRLAVGNVRA